MTRSILFVGSAVLSSFASVALMACEVKVNHPDNPPPVQTATPAATTVDPAAAPPPPPPAPAPRIDGH